jgi:hypothetical protein
MLGWIVRTERKLVQPGFVLGLSMLLWFLVPIIPTEGRVAHAFHIADYVCAALLFVIGVVWLFGPWGFKDKTATSYPLASVDQDTGKVTNYNNPSGQRTGASPEALPEGGYALHTEEYPHSWSDRLWHRNF